MATRKTISATFGGTRIGALDKCHKILNLSHQLVHLPIFTCVKELVSQLIAQSNTAKPYQIYVKQRCCAVVNSL